jgi:hypothetical protein
MRRTLAIKPALVAHRRPNVIDTAHAAEPAIAAGHTAHAAGIAHSATDAGRRAATAASAALSYRNCGDHRCACKRAQNDFTHHDTNLLVKLAKIPAAKRS